MAWRLAADAVLVVHLAFVLFVALGGFLITSVLYPGELTPTVNLLLWLGMLAAATVPYGWWLVRRRRRQRCLKSSRSGSMRRSRFSSLKFS